MECTSACGTIACLLAWADAHATAIVALIALTFSFWQIRTFREHNRLTVRPRMVLWLDSSIAPDGANTTTVVAKNVGLGPAYVTNIEYQFNGTAVDVHDPVAVQKVMDAAFGHRWVKASPLVDIRGVLPIPKDGELALLRIHTDAGTGLLEEDVQRLRKNFRTVLDYLSAYNEVFREAGSSAGSGRMHHVRA